MVERWGALILTCCKPCLLASLTILLGNYLEIGTSLKCIVDRIGTLSALLCCSTSNLNLTILYRIRKQLLRHKLDNVKSIVRVVLKYLACRANCH